MCVISDDKLEKADAEFTGFEPKSFTVHYDNNSEKIIDDLVLACEAALLLRGLWMAVNDPLALAGEKEAYRKRFKEIEAQIRQAINAAKK